MMWLAGGIGAVAFAATALAALLLQPPGPVDPGTTLKGPPDMEVFSLHPDKILRKYQGQTLGQGDELGFQVYGGDFDEVVVLSVDGVGNISVYYPDEGERSHPLGTSEEVELQPLPNTVILDGAPGPEVFVAVFGKSVEESLSTVYGQSLGGPEALLDWADDTVWADAVRVERVPVMEQVTP